MAILMERKGGPSMGFVLARMPLAGGAPRELLEDVMQADWSPDGEALAVLRGPHGQQRLEYPVGTVLVETTGWLSDPRVSSKGDLVAFLEHPMTNDDRGAVAVVDRAGRKTVLSSGWGSIAGLAWSPSGDEVWFTAAKMAARGLYAVALDGRERAVLRAPGTLTLFDISNDGRVLLALNNMRRRLIARPPGATEERDLSWLDFPTCHDISADGKWVLFDESGEGGGERYGVYMRKTDGSPAVRLGEGAAAALSPDMKWALSMPIGQPRQLILLPTGPGTARPLTNDAIDHRWARWFPDGKRILFVGKESDRPPRLYVQSLAGGGPQPLAADGPFVGLLVSPDGKEVLVQNEKGAWRYPVSGGPPREVHFVDAKNDEPLEWARDGLSILLGRREGTALVIERMSLATGKRAPVTRIVPPTPWGGLPIRNVQMTPDGKAYVYTYQRMLSDLFLVEGLK
jgi:Tol biopolymer transport system component